MSLTFLACGDSALVLQLDDKIDAGTNDRVITLAAMLEAERDSGRLNGVIDIVPTYRSLLVCYDPAQIRGVALEFLLRGIDQNAQDCRATIRLWDVPCLYGGEIGQDLDELAEMKGLTTDKLIAIHSGTEYRVYMIGFAPGFVYLGGQPAILDTPRLLKPRQNIARGAIGIGGQQGNINSVAGPSGWRFLGWTPVRSFDPGRPDPFLFRAGDRIRFYPISMDEAQELDLRIAAGDTVIAPQELSP